jgi:serine/threonine-protein kinase RsbT
MTDDGCILVENEEGILTARQKGRELARALGFSDVDQAVVATAISELARNLVEHARGGGIIISAERKQERAGIVVTVRDSGPGIPDIALAMQDGYSTKKGLGLGLPGAKRLMDEFEIESQIGNGTTITMKKWRQ